MGLYQAYALSLERLFPLTTLSGPFLRRTPNRSFLRRTSNRSFLRRTSNRSFLDGRFLSRKTGYCLLIAGHCISEPGSRRLFEEHQPPIKLKSSGLEIPLGPPIGLVEEY
jgi:hypothetical protein